MPSDAVDAVKSAILRVSNFKNKNNSLKIKDILSPLKI